MGVSKYCSTLPRAFTYIVLEYALGLTPEEIEDSITDGPDDRGIDAVFIDDRSGHNVIHLFQFKHAAHFQKSKNNFPSNEIDKLLSFCADVLGKARGMSRTCNPLLWAKVQEIWDALKNPDPSFQVHLCGNMQPLVEAQNQRLISALEPYRSFTVLDHSLGIVVAAFLEKKAPKIDAELRIVDKNYFERADGSIRGLIVTIEAMELARLISNPHNTSEVREGIFNDNVRVYLTKKNRINRKIHSTALSEKNAEFWYLNNGITMTCDSFSYQPGTRSPSVSMKNVQIVNGGQTSNALFEACRENSERMTDVLLLARIYETKDRSITTRIAEATNSQTPINTRDLRSNDEVQKKLEEGLRDQGLFYERKAHQHLGKPRQKRIDALSAGQAMLAYIHGYPEVAKKDRARVFDDLYDTIFNDDLTTDKVVIPLRIYGDIESQKRDLQRRIKKDQPFDRDLLFLIDGAYHLLYAVGELCARDEINVLDEAQAKTKVPEAIAVLKELVKRESKADEAFTTSRFFKDARTKTKIQRLVSTTGGGRTRPRRRLARARG